MKEVEELTLIRHEENSLVPWQNGAGLTRQIAISPSDAGIHDFNWRISVAEIENDSLYSQFSQTHRTQVLLNGDGVELTLPHKVCVLNKQYQLIEFSGDDAVSCHPLQGRCQVLNVMAREAMRRPEVSVMQGAYSKNLNHQPRVFYVAQGTYGVVLPEGVHITLRTADALLVKADQFRFESTATSDAVLIEITLH